MALLSLKDAEVQRDHACPPLPLEERDLGDALGCVLAADIHAQLTQPQWPQVAMDGYAILLGSSQSKIWPLQHGIAPAGAPTQTLEPGHALRVTTGSPMPHGADTVVMQEDTRETDGRIELLAAVAQDANIRPAGQDFCRGDVIAKAGAQIHAGLLASLRHAGVHTVCVRPKPRLAVIITGSELIHDAQAPSDGMTPDTNGPFVKAWAAEQGYPCSVHHCDEAPASLTQLITTLKGTFDALIVCGGASVSPRDGSHAGLLGADARCVFTKVAQKPGKPMALYTLGPIPALLLPGNPAAVFCGTWWHLHPLLQGLQGQSPNRKTSFVLTNNAPRIGGRSSLLRAHASVDAQGQLQATLLPGQLSHLLGNLGECNALLQFDPGTAIAAGETVKGYWLA